MLHSNVFSGNFVHPYWAHENTLPPATQGHQNLFQISRPLIDIQPLTLPGIR